MKPGIPVRLVILSLVAGVLLLAAGPAGATSRAQRVAVTLKEFSITLPAKLQPGPTTFTLTNKGKFPHDMVVVFHAQGSQFGTPKVQPGKTLAYTTTLKPGSYVVVCNVGDGYHESQGMVATFTVGKFSFTTGKWSA
jgi:plastocyanin